MEPTRDVADIENAGQTFRVCVFVFDCSDTSAEIGRWAINLERELVQEASVFYKENPSPDLPHLIARTGIHYFDILQTEPGETFRDSLEKLPPGELDPRD